MQTITLTLQLLDPIVISQSSATEGTHQSLDYIPGSNILGAFASKLYAKIKAKNSLLNAFELFHSGQVRFNNAFPVYSNKTSYPIPLSLHYEKGQAENNITNSLFKNIQDNKQGNKQLKQHRKGYITADLAHLKIKSNLHLRTAINNQTGTAKDSQLFGYQSIPAGISYQTTIDIDNAETAQQLFKQIKTITEIRLGRSKTAQYGRVKITITPPTKANKPISPIIKLNDEEYLVFWLTSDLIAYNQQGQPTLTPSLKDLGLLDSQAGDIPIDASKSWLRTRSYSPYNSFRKSYDMEQQVISQGSLLIYPKTDINLTKLQQAIGLNTQAGHGKIADLTSYKKLFQPNLTTTEKKADWWKIPTENTHKTELIKILEKKYQLQNSKQKIQQQVENDIKDFIKLTKSSRSYQAIPNNIPIGPSKTQWSRIRDELTKRNFDNKQQIIEFLFEGNTAIIKKDDDAWQQANHEDSFAKLIRKKINKCQEDATIYTRSLAREASHNEQLNQARGGQA